MDLNKLITNLQPHQEWISELRQANCSCLAIINNKTSDILFRTDFVLASGMWRAWPDELIKPMGQIVFGSESFGFCTGTEGRVEYSISGNNEPFRMEWSIPFFSESKTTVSEHQNYRISKEEWLQNKKSVVEFTIHDPFDGDYRHNNQPISLITTTPVVYESWKLQMKKAQRSIMITLSNTTEYSLQLLWTDLHHGIWSMLPPNDVASNSTYDFGSESHGLMSTEGEVVYNIVNKKNQVAEGTISFIWDVPMLGAPQFSSNIFAIEPRVLGNHCEVCLHFSSDETFLLQFKEDIPSHENTINNNIIKLNNNDTNVTPKRKSIQENRPTIISSPLLQSSTTDKQTLEKITSYGFDGDDD